MRPTPGHNQIPLNLIRRHLLALATLVLALVVAACSQAQQTTTPTVPGSTPTPTVPSAGTSTPMPSTPTASPTPGGTPPALPIMINLTEHPDLGPILTDSEGRVLYLFTRDEQGVSNCTGGCLDAWPPVVTTGDPAGGEGVDTDRLGTIQRDDGTLQATYNGWPLYYYSGDMAPGDANGQDVNGVWYVVSSYGGPIFTTAEVTVTENETLGPILTDPSGRTLYLFTNDAPNTSNCSGNCALNWPPLLTIEEPTAGEGASQDLLGTIQRDDGTMQVTYNGWPLYYFYNDPGPGEIAGQGLNNVWYAVSPEGEMVQ